MRALVAGVTTVGGVATLWACSGQCARWAAGECGAALPPPASAPGIGAIKMGIDNIATPPTSPERIESSGEGRAGAEVATPGMVLSARDKSVDPLMEEHHDAGRHSSDENLDTLDDVAAPQNCRVPLSEVGKTSIERGPDTGGNQREPEGAPELESAPTGPFADHDTQLEGKDETGELMPRESPEDRVIESSVEADTEDGAGKATVDHDLQTVVDKSMKDHTANDSHNADHAQPEMARSQEIQPIAVRADNVEVEVEVEGEEEDDTDLVPEPRGVDGDDGSGPAWRPKDSALPRPPQVSRVAAARKMFDEGCFASADAASALSMREPVMDEKTRRSASLAMAFTQLRDDLTSIEADAVADCNGCPVAEQPDISVESSSDQTLATVLEHEAMAFGVARDQCSSTCSSDSDADYTECIDDGRPHGTPTVVPWHPIEEVPPNHRSGPDAPVAFVHRPQTSAFKRVD